MITVIDAMNGMGQDWECSEVLRAEVRRLRTDLAAAEQRATDAEATLATIGGADKATLARKLRRANAATRDAEQRAKESDARAERLAAACKIGLGVIVRSDLKGKEPREAIAVLTTALAAPATQPDERAAAERAVIAAARPVLGILRGTHSAFNQVIYSQALGDALSALDALDATDGAAKEGA